MADDHGDTLLHVAALGGHAKCVEFLRASLAIDVAGAMARTPLHAAVLGGRLELAMELIDAKASVHAADRKGWTALHFASEAGQPASIKFLLGAGMADDIRRQAL